MMHLNVVCIITQRGNFMELHSLLYKLKHKIGQHIIKDLYLLLYLIRNIAAFRKITCFYKKPTHSLWLILFLWSCMLLKLGIWSFRMSYLYNQILFFMLLSNQFLSQSPLIAITATYFFLSLSIIMIIITMAKIYIVFSQKAMETFTDVYIYRCIVFVK